MDPGWSPWREPIEPLRKRKLSESSLEEWKNGSERESGVCFEDGGTLFMEEILRLEQLLTEGGAEMELSEGYESEWSGDAKSAHQEKVVTSENAVVDRAVEVHEDADVVMKIAMATATDTKSQSAPGDKDFVEAMLSLTRTMTMMWANEEVGLLDEQECQVDIPDDSSQSLPTVEREMPKLNAVLESDTYLRKRGVYNESLDGKPLAMSDAAELEPGVDRKVNERDGATCSVITQQVNVVGHSRSFATVHTVGSILESQERSVNVFVPASESGRTIFYEGMKFDSKKGFELFYAAQKLEERVIRALALNVKDAATLLIWEEELKLVMSQRGGDGDLLKLYYSEASEIWNTEAGSASAVPVKECMTTDGPELEESPAMTTATVTPCASVHCPMSTLMTIGSEVSKNIDVVVNGVLMQTKGSVNGMDVLVLNDSGADISCISHKQALRLGLRVEATSIAVYNPNGQRFKCLGQVQMELQFGPKRFQCTCIVIEDLEVELLVGDDFLRRYNCVLSYGMGCISYDGYEVKTCSRIKDQDEKRIYRITDGSVVVAAQDILLKPGQLMMTSGRVLLPQGYQPREHVWLMEPLSASESEYGTAIVPSIVMLDRRNMVNILLSASVLMNGTTIIPTGTVLGIIHTLPEGDKGTVDCKRINAISVLSELDQEEMPSSGSTRQVTSQGLEEEAQESKEFSTQMDRIFKDLPQELSAEEGQLLKEVLVKYQGTLCPTKLGSTHVTTVDIDPGVARPVCHRDRRWSPQETIAIKSQVESLLAAGIIEPSESPWSNRIVCAPKKSADGSKTDIRVCVDFRDVNALCVKDAYPAPNVEATLDQLNKSVWYSAIDLAKGYHQVPLTERAKQICSFRCPFGFFRYTHMPFGIMNAPAAFQRMMDVVLRGITWRHCMVYMDDVIIYSSSWSDHMSHITSVLQRIQDAGLTVGLSKCHFGKKEISFLGYNVSREGIRPDPRKVTSIRAFTRPSTLTELRSFLGLASQFRKFVRNFGDLVRPLQTATRKDAHREWASGSIWSTERCRSFEAVKTVIAEAVVLAHPRYDRPLLMVCDASDYGMGAMLAQLDEGGQERPIAFTSAAFFGPALNYTTTEKEGLAVVWAATHFRPYIHGIPTVVVTDHSALTYILSRGNPPQRIAHWVMELSQYDFTYIHRKGAHNNVADALSRLQTVMEETMKTDGTDLQLPASVHAVKRRKKKKTKAKEKEKEEDIHVKSPEAQVDKEIASDVEDEVAPPTTASPLTTRIPYQVVTAGTTVVGLPAELTVEAFIAEQLMDDDLRAMKEYLQNGLLPQDRNLAYWIVCRSDEFMLKGGLLLKAERMRRGKERTVKLVTVVPLKLRKDLIAAYHNHPAIGGHMDTVRTCTRIRQLFWWSRLYSDVADYVKSCLTCRTTAKRTATAAPVKTHEQPSRPFEFMAVDLLSLPESESGNKYAMVLVDYFTRYVIVVPIKDKRGATITKAIMEKVVLVHGRPEQLLSDKGGEFDNELLQEVCVCIGTKKAYTTPYRPQSDGMVERFNRTLLRLLTCFVDHAQCHWDDTLPYVLYAYNTSISSATGERPFSIVYGRDPPSEIYVDVVNAAGQLKMASDPTSWKDEIKQYLSQEYLQELRDIDTSKKISRNKTANKGRRAVRKLVVGAVVLIANHRPPEEGEKKKLAKKQRGLYVVTKILTEVTVELRRVAAPNERLQILHVDNLEPVKVSARKYMVLSAAYPPTREDTVEEAEKEVQKTPKKDEERYEIEKITQMRLVDGQLQFFVHWEGYDEEDANWEIEANLNAGNKVEQFVSAAGGNILK